MKSILIGHRGEPETWPENSLSGFSAVLEAGACYIETDVQITADGIAILSHDPSVLKVTGTDLLVTTSSYDALRDLPAGHSGRFGDQYRNLRLTRLDELVDLLQQWPTAKAFIEIKHASIEAHGTAMVVDTVLAVLKPVQQQCILISFNYEALLYSRKNYPLPIGWVLSEWSTASKARASDLAPEYLFCSRKRLPAITEPLWQGPWQWAVYTVNIASEVAGFLNRGIQLVETNTITRILADPES